jgi:hypothetical protein
MTCYGVGKAAPRFRNAQDSSLSNDQQKPQQQQRAAACFLRCVAPRAGGTRRGSTLGHFCPDPLVNNS